MAFALRVKSVLRRSSGRIVWVGLLCLLAVALLSACDDGPTETPTPEPTPATSTPTPDRVGAPAIRDFGIDTDTLWGELFDRFTTSEQSCIRIELGDELLESVLERRAMPEGDTQQWEASIFGCLAPETASGLFLSALVARMKGLTEEAEGCLRELLADADMADIVAGTLPDASPAAATAALKFTDGLLSCVPDQILSGDAGPPDPPQADVSLLWRNPPEAGLSMRRPWSTEWSTQGLTTTTCMPWTRRPESCCGALRRTTS